MFDPNPVVIAMLMMASIIFIMFWGVYVGF
jgi:hypothetical protein